MKIKNLALLFLAIFALQSCDDTDAYFGGEDDPIDPPSFNRLSDIIKFENVVTDTLSFNPLENSTVEGSFGVKIFLPAGCVGGTINDSIGELFVVLREYPTITKMGLGNVQTVSDQELLVTGGNFWWNIVDSEGNSYELAYPENVFAEQPVVLDMGDYRNRARYYEGQVVEEGGQEVLNWTLGNFPESFWSEDNTIFNYYGIDIGWVNCDALNDYPGERTQFQVTLNTDLEVQDSEQMVLFVVDDFPSIVNLTTREGNTFSTFAESIPMGISGTLIGIALDTEGNILVGSTEITVAGDDQFQIDLAEGDLSDYTNLLNQASN